MKKTKKNPESKVKISLLRALGKKLKLLCEKNQQDIKKKDDQSKFQDDLELKKEVHGDERPSLQERLDDFRKQFDLDNLNPTEGHLRCKVNQEELNDDLELKKEVPSDEHDLQVPEMKHLDDLDSLDFTEYAIANKQLDHDDLNPTKDYLGSKVNQEEQNEGFSNITPTLMDIYNCEICETPFSAEHFVIAHLKKHHKLFKDFENCIKITERKI